MSTTTQTKKPAARIVTRDEDQADAQRMPDREVKRNPNEIRTRSGRVMNGLMFTGSEDRFAFDRSIVPQGWTYEWKTKTIKNWEWQDHQVMLYQNGWEPVPAERHDGVFMPRGHKGTIERGGMILMERPIELTIMARKVEKRAADEPVIGSRSMAGLMAKHVPGAQDVIDFNTAEARSKTGVRVERLPRVNDAKYTLEE